MLRIGHARETVVPQNVCKILGFVDDLLGVVTHVGVCLVSGAIQMRLT